MNPVPQISEASPKAALSFAPIAGTSQGESKLAGESFTAAQISSWLGLTDRAVRKRLGGGAADETPGGGGRSARRWRLEDLPADWREQLTEISARKGYPSLQAMLADSQAGPWQPPLPFDKLADRFKRDARQWRDALLPILTRQNHAPPGELLALGLSECRRVFRRDLSEATWRRHFDLAAQRDGSFLQWARLDLYVPEAAYTRASAASSSRAAGVAKPDMGQLTDAFSQVADPSHLKPEDRDAVFESLLAYTEQGGKPGPALDYALGALPGLAKTPEALSRWFRCKRQALRLAGNDPEAVKDKRPGQSGRKGARLCPECVQILVGATVQLDGNLPQAWRRLIKEKKLCPRCPGQWHHDVRDNKSYVPKAVREQVMPIVLAALPFRHGIRFARLHAPYVLRKPDIGPGDVFEADDLTQNHVFYAYEPGESGGFYVGRGEMLLLVDRRTQYPITYVLKCGEILPGGERTRASYNGLDVRDLILRGHDRVGLPHEGFLFENGVWASRLVDGKKVNGWEFNEWRQYERGLNEEGIVFAPSGRAVRHALPSNARTKLIERTILSVQEQMTPHKGFAGFNHREYRPEQVNEYLRRVKQGEDPAQWFYSLTQIRNVLDAELMRFADDVENGTWRSENGRGVSPKEAWLNGIGGKPGLRERGLRQLPETARWKLATHGRRVQVTGKGIRFELGSKALVFWGDELLPYQYKMLDVRLNLEEPELLHCIPPDGKVFTMKLREYGSDHATREEMAEVGAARSRWVRHGKRIYDNLPHPLISTVKVDTEHSPEVHGVGEQINRATAEHREQKAATTREQRRLKSLAGTLGISQGVKDRERAIAAAQRRLERRSQAEVEP